jgi:hypothetical protein
MLTEDNWLFDGYENPAPMPVRRRTMGDREGADKPSHAGQTVGKRKIVGEVEPLSVWSDPDNPPISPGAKLEQYEPHFRRRKAAFNAKRAAARQVFRDSEASRGRHRRSAS